MRICVIMSVYNGVDYLSEQLDSIYKQDVNGEIIVFIRDDGSQDGTLEQIQKRAEYKAGKIVVEKGKNVGAAKSFLYAINQAPDADYYAFCDQDDVWIQGKLKKAIEAIKNVKKDIPVLWVSNYDVVDKSLRVILKSPVQYPVMDDLRVLFYNNIPGCVMVFNKNLLQQLRKVKIEEIRMHDIMTLNIALITGRVLYEENAYILYRQHEHNVLGYGSKKIRPIKWLMDKFRLLIHKESYDISEYSKCILKNFAPNMTNEKILEYELIKDYKKSFRKKIQLLNKPYTKAKRSRTSISIRCKILLGLM